MKASRVYYFFSLMYTPTETQRLRWLEARNKRLLSFDRNSARTESFPQRLLLRLYRGRFLLMVEASREPGRRSTYAETRPFRRQPRSLSIRADFLGDAGQNTILAVKRALR